MMKGDIWFRVGSETSRRTVEDEGRRRERGRWENDDFFLNTGTGLLSFVTEALIAALRDGDLPKGLAVR